MIHFVMLNVEKALLLLGSIFLPHVFSLAFVPNHVMNFYTSAPRSVREPRAADMILRVKNTIKTGLRVNGSWVTALYAQKSRNSFRVADSYYLHHIVSFHKRDWWTQFSVRISFSAASEPHVIINYAWERTKRAKTRNWKFSRDFEI